MQQQIKEDDEFFIINEQQNENIKSPLLDKKNGFIDNVAAIERIFVQQSTQKELETIFATDENREQKQKQADSAANKLSHTKSVETMRSKITLTHRMDHPQ